MLPPLERQIVVVHVHRIVTLHRIRLRRVGGFLQLRRARPDESNLTGVDVVVRPVDAVLIGVLPRLQLAGYLDPLPFADLKMVDTNKKPSLILQVANNL